MSDDYMLLVIQGYAVDKSAMCIFKQSCTNSYVRVIELSRAVNKK
jgi:hypothetical protein